MGIDECGVKFWTSKSFHHTEFKICILNIPKKDPPLISFKETHEPIQEKTASRPQIISKAH